MDRVKPLLLLLSSLLYFLTFPSSSSATILKVEGGVYSRITVRLDNSVPRQFCRRAIDNVQVGWGQQQFFDDAIGFKKKKSWRINFFFTVR